MHLSHLTGAPGAFALCLALAIVPPAQAEAPLARHFGAENRCYGIRFPEAHMIAHPDQQLRAIRLDHFPRLFGLDDGQGGLQIYPDAREIVISLTVWLRGEEAGHDGSGFCWPEGDHFFCTLECDAGQFRLYDRGQTVLRLSQQTDLQFRSCEDADQAQVRTLPQAQTAAGLTLVRLPDSNCQPPR